MKKLVALVVLGGIGAMVWRELPSIKRYLNIESM
jgi:hypothetical protein